MSDYYFSALHIKINNYISSLIFLVCNFNGKKCIKNEDLNAVDNNDAPHLELQKLWYVDRKAEEDHEHEAGSEASTYLNKVHSRT